MNNRPRAPLLVTVNVTGVCNLTCRYCYFQPRMEVHIKMEEYKRVLTTLKNHEIFLLTLSGGEPFLHPEINELLQLAHDNFEEVSVLTNGTVIDRFHLETISKIIAEKGYFHIQVSLDSLDSSINDNTRGNTGNVLETLSKLKDIGVNVTVAIVISSKNVDRLKETIVGLLDVTHHFHVMPFKPVPFLKGEDDYLRVDPQRMQKAWEELIALRDQYGIKIRTPLDELCNRVETFAVGAPCMAGFTKLSIDPNLDVRPCDKCVTAVVGNLREETLEAIWNGSRMNNIYQRDVSYCFSESMKVV